MWVYIFGDTYLEPKDIKDILMLSIDTYRIKTQWSELEDATCKYYSYLSTIANIINREVSGNTATTHRGDFVSLLYHYDVPKELHKFNMYINKLNNSCEYNGARIIKLCYDNNITNLISKLG